MLFIKWQKKRNYHEYSNKRPNSNIERVMEVVADPGEGDPEGQAQQACLYQN